MVSKCTEKTSSPLLFCLFQRGHSFLTGAYTRNSHNNSQWFAAVHGHEGQIAYYSTRYGGSPPLVNLYLHGPYISCLSICCEAIVRIPCKYDECPKVESCGGVKDLFILLTCVGMFLLIVVMGKAPDVGYVFSASVDVDLWRWHGVALPVVAGQSLMF